MRHYGTASPRAQKKKGLEWLYSLNTAVIQDALAYAHKDGVNAEECDEKAVKDFQECQESI